MQATTDLSPAMVEARIRYAMRPQLRDLMDLERKYERAARIERLRRRYDMWDTHDSAVEAYATGQAVGDVATELGKQVGAMYASLRDGIQKFFQGFATVVNNPPPVPAQDHATLTRPDLW